MATRERKATRSNTDSPTISNNSSSRSDTASPVTVVGQRSANKSKAESTTPVRNPLRSTRAGSVAQGSQSGSPPDANLPPPSADSVDVNEEEDTKSVRSRPTRQTTVATTETSEDKQPSGRGIRKPVVANVHSIKRNSLPIVTGRAAKMTTRRNSSGKMEAILKACAEDDAGALVAAKPKRGRPVTSNSQTTINALTGGERRTLLRRKRASSVDTAREKEDSMVVDGAAEEDEDEEEEESSKCESEQSEKVEKEDQVDQPPEEEKVIKAARGRPVGRKRKRGGFKRNSPVKRVATDGDVEVKVKSETLGDEDEEVDAEEDNESVVVPAEEDEEEEKNDIDEEEKVKSVNGEEEEEKETEGVESGKKDESSEEVEVSNGKLTIKVEPLEGKEDDEEEQVVEKKDKLDKELLSPSPSLPRDNSLSPVSVQQICGQPAFLENNPGIEKDPQVAAEMGVQVQQKAEQEKSQLSGEECQDKNTEEKENENQENVQPEEKSDEVKEKEKDTPEDQKAVDSSEIKTKDEDQPPTVVIPEIKKEPESPECSTKKENHLKVLGLLTLRAADQAKHEKARRREILKAFPTPPSISLQQLSAGGDSDGGGNGNGNGNKASRNGGAGGNQEYTGTLKTVIKLNRKNGNSAKGSGNGGAGGGATGASGRQSLKMTFQKGRGKGASGQNGAAGGGSSGSATGKDSRQSASEGEEYYTISKEVGNSATGGGVSSVGTITGTGTDCGGSTHSGEDGGKEEKDLVIPEKAASFSIHPDRLCQDQCFYCGGKFGLFDTPLHIAQIKSQERQKKILDNEEKLTADSCLCDACYRHVDRRANCPSYKKRLSAPASLDVRHQQQQQQQQQEAMDVDESQPGKNAADPKKNRGNIQKCSLCKERISKSRSFPLTQNVKRLEDTMRGQGISVQWGITPVVCKLCKLYTEHLTKELRGEAHENNNQFADNYRRRLISFYKQEAERKRRLSQENQQQQQQLQNQGRQQQSSVSGFEQSEASRALSRNPAISIRELFPGEDEMGISVHLPFGNQATGGLRTPEGWTRSYSLLQYDDATRQLWEELQRPYGNQSSFIRHLVLLEKYFRNGDLVLSKNASSNAATYSESVQTRLRAFDSVSLENRTLLKQLSNAPITITQKAPALTAMPTTAGTGGTGNKAQPVQPPVTITPATTVTAQSSPPPLVPTTAKVLDAGTSLLKKSLSSMPPDLISITTPGSGGVAITGVPREDKNDKGGSTTVAAATGTSTSPSNATTTVTTSKRTGSPTKARETVVVTLPDTLSPQDRKLVNGKSWRPTLMPVERIELNEDGTRTMFKTADGRLLPSRVQVMSGGKPYHISIYDYNRMCILRREKLVQKAMNGQKSGATAAGAGGDTTTSTSGTPATMGSPPSANGKVVTGASASGSPNHRQTIVATTVQIPNTVLEQNSFTPVTSSGFLSATAANHGGGDQVVNGSATVANGGLGEPAGGPTTRRNSRSSAAAKNAALSVVQLGSQITATVTSNSNNNNNNSSSTTTTRDGKRGSHEWMWNNHDVSKDKAQVTATTESNSSSSAATASLLSRIPKSLTVIPQQKLM